MTGVGRDSQPPNRLQATLEAAPAWARVHLAASCLLMLLALITLPLTTDLNVPGTGCVHTEVSFPIAFFLIGASYLALLTLCLRLRNTPQGSRANRQLLVSAGVIALVGLAAVSLPSGGTLMLIYLGLSAIGWLPVLVVVLASDLDLPAPVPVLIGLALALSLLFLALIWLVGPHPIPVC